MPQEPTSPPSQRRAIYPSDVSDEEWAFCAPCLCLMREDAPQREHSLRELFNGLRYIVRAGCPWRMLPHDLPPWFTIHQQARRWIKAGCFEAMAHDLRAILRLAVGKEAQPTAVVMDGRTLQSSCESGPRAGYDGYKRRKGSKVHAAVDTLGHLLALKVTAASEQERAQVGELMSQVQEATGGSMKVAFADQGCTGSQPGEEAAKQGVTLEIVKFSEAKKGFVLLPKRWVWNAPSAGRRVSAASAATTNASQAPSPAFTGLPPSSSCYTTSFKVHDTL